VREPLLVTKGRFNPGDVILGQGSTRLNPKEITKGFGEKKRVGKRDTGFSCELKIPV